MSFLADYHTHTVFSNDGYNTAGEMAAAATALGLDELAITDHYDMYVTQNIYSVYDPRAAKEAFGAAQRAFGKKISLVHGVELGEYLHDRATASAVLREGEYDFVLGSLHNLYGEEDFYRIVFTSHEQCYSLIERYIAELTEMTLSADFDVLGHLTYPLRYMHRRAPFDVDFRPFEEGLRALLRAVVQCGCGIELNYSGLRREGRETMPDPWCLKLYRECGGEILTLGSDAHRAGHLGLHMDEAADIARAAGFRYVAGYRGRKPEMNRL